MSVSLCVSVSVSDYLLPCFEDNQAIYREACEELRSTSHHMSELAHLLRPLNTHVSEPGCDSPQVLPSDETAALADSLTSTSLQPQRP